MSCPQIWNIKKEKDREKEKEGGRPAKLNQKKGDRDIERDIKKGDVFFVGSGGDKMRAANNQIQGENERR